MNYPNAENGKEMLLDVKLPQYSLLQQLQNLKSADFFAKIFDGKIASASVNILERNNLDNEEEIIGLTDKDLYPNYITEKIVMDDSIECFKKYIRKTPHQFRKTYQKYRSLCE